MVNQLFLVFGRLGIKLWLDVPCDNALKKYRVIQNDCRGFNNMSYTIHLFLQM